MEYEDFTKQFINQRNPATGMYYTTNEAATAAGIDPNLAQQYTTQAQVGNAIGQGIMPTNTFDWSQQPSFQNLLPQATNATNYYNAVGAANYMGDRRAAHQNPDMAGTTNYLTGGTARNDAGQRLQTDRLAQNTQMTQGSAPAGSFNWDTWNNLTSGIDWGKNTQALQGQSISNYYPQGTGGSMTPEQLQVYYGRLLANAQTGGAYGTGQVPQLNIGSTPQLSQAKGVNYSPGYWNASGELGPFINSSGGYSYAGLPGMTSFLNQYYGEGMGRAAGTESALTGYLGELLSGGYPQDMPYWIQNLVNQQGGIGSQLMSGQSDYLMNQFQPWMNADLQTIIQYGLPNQELINSLAAPQVTYGQNQQNAAANLAAMLSGGYAPQTGLQSQLSNQLSGLIGGSGLTPEYVNAARQTILDPSQENLQGQLNRMGAGVVAPSSGLQQELLRRNESDFNNYLIQQGLNNLGNYMGQANTLGGQTFGQGLNLASLQSGMGQQGIQNALNAYGTNQLGLNALTTANQLAYNPLYTGSNMTNAATGTGSNLLNQYMGALLGLQGNQQNYALGLGNQYNNLLANYLNSYDNYQKLQAALESGNADWIGNMFGTLLGTAKTLAGGGGNT